MRNIVIFISLLFFSNYCLGQKQKIDSLFIQFQQANFYGSIYPAKKRLENYQKEIIPKLIKLLDSEEFVKLNGTADLIYPGMTTFYGHGHFVPYNMDWIAVRVGWLLEDLTFENFGYKTSGNDNDSMIKLLKENYPEYIESGTINLEWKNKTPNQKQIELNKLLAKKVKKWWKENKNKWTRLNAIKSALTSNDEERLSKALQYLRFKKSECDNYNETIYIKEIKPLVENLQSTSYPDVLTDVQLLLETYDWKQ